MSGHKDGIITCDFTDAVLYVLYSVWLGIVYGMLRAIRSQARTSQGDVVASESACSRELKGSTHIVSNCAETVRAVMPALRLILLHAQQQPAAHLCPRHKMS